MVEALPVMISGKRVGLRAVEFDELGELLAWRNRPEFRQYFRETRELNWEQQTAWFSEKCIKDPNTRMFSIVRLSGAMLIGACGLCAIDWVNGSADLSLYIGHDNLYIDTEYAPDVARVLIDYAFNDLRLHRLWAEVYSFDERKQALFKNLGFRQDGVHQHTKWLDGAWHDSVYFSFLSKIQN